MEFVQLHPTGMVWPPSVRGLLVTESVRGDGGVLRNSEGKRFMFNYVPDVFRAQYAETEEEADRWYDDPDHNRRPPELLPRDEVARSINSEVKAGRGSPHGGVFLDIASRRPAEYILRRLPSMYHQFKELADVDITKEPMEIGPTAHYVMGGVEVDPDTGAASVPGLFAAGEVSGGMHGSNRLGGNSLSDLLVFGRRSGAGRRRVRLGAVRAARRLGRGRGRGRGLGAAAAGAGRGREPVRHPRRAADDHERPGRAHPPRVGDEDRAGRAGQAADPRRAGHPRRAAGPTTPAGTWPWTCATCSWSRSAWPSPRWNGRNRAAGTPGRTTRPCRPEWRKVNLICSLDADGDVTLRRQPMVPMRTDLLELFDVSELHKYMTDEELAGLPGAEVAEEKPSAPPTGAPPGVLPEAGQKAPSSAPPPGAPPARRTARKAGK